MGAGVSQKVAAWSIGIPPCGLSSIIVWASWLWVGKLA
jgi:hypothetical protein